MALVLDGPYKNKPVSVFYISRAARVYPAYFVSLILSLAVIAATTGWSFFNAFLSMNWLHQSYVVLTNLFIFGQDFAYLFCLSDAVTGQCYPVTTTMLNAPGWSIAVELLFYLMAPWLVSTLRRSAIFITLGLLYVFLVPFVDIEAVRNIIGNSPHLNTSTFTYYLFPGSFLFFGSGAIAYHLIYRRHILAGSQATGSTPYWIGLAFVFVLAVYCSPLMAWWQLLAFVIAAPALFSITRQNRVDRAIGDLSYPIYILHFPIVSYLQVTAYAGPVSIGTLAAILTIAAGIVVFWLVDRPVDRWRHRMVAAYSPKSGNMRTENSIVT
jgi:peptidoglycan/LPS O-acetylase OafA/YrhL